MAGLVDAFDAENAGDFFDICEDSFELALIGDFKVGIDARVGAVGAALEVVNVGAGVADDGGDVCQKAGAVAVILTGARGAGDASGGLGTSPPIRARGEPPADDAPDLRRGER